MRIDQALIEDESAIERSEPFVDRSTGENFRQNEPGAGFARPEIGQLVREDHGAILLARARRPGAEGVPGVIVCGFETKGMLEALNGFFVSIQVVENSRQPPVVDWVERCRGDGLLEDSRSFSIVAQ